MSQVLHDLISGSPLIFESLGIFAILDREGRYIYTSRNWREVFHPTMKNPLGVHVSEVYPDTKAMDAMEKGTPILAWPVRAADQGSTRLFTSYFPILDENTVIGCAILTFFRNQDEAMRFSEVFSKVCAERDLYRQELRRLQGGRYSIDQIIGESEAIQQVKRQIRQAARTTSNVLIEGETGTGKELVSHAIHNLSARSVHPLIKLNCAAMGYPEINLNLGCPSGTVVAKGKGSGFLGLPEELERFLDTVFDAAPCAVSIKTRLGLREPEESGPLLALFRRYPLAELIVHPRVQKDMYKNTPRRAYFARALADSPFPVCYNGDLYTVPALEAFQAEFLAAERIMLGRGLAGDPALARKAGGGPVAGREELRAFHDQVYEGYAEAFGSRRNAMLRMKEVWFYLIHLFGDSQRHAKAIRKARDTGEYESAVTAVFRELELLPELRPEW